MSATNLLFLIILLSVDALCASTSATPEEVEELRKGHLKHIWDPHDDYLLATSVPGFTSSGDTDWAKLSTEVFSRRISPKQCRDRWTENVNPALDHSALTVDERVKLAEIVRAGRRDWVEIQREHFPTRSDLKIRNNAYALLTRNDAQKKLWIEAGRRKELGKPSQPLGLVSLALGLKRAAKRPRDGEASHEGADRARLPTAPESAISSAISAAQADRKQEDDAGSLDSFPELR